jgi:hypothetical protein
MFLNQWKCPVLARPLLKVAHGGAVGVRQRCRKGDLDDDENFIRTRGDAGHDRFAGGLLVESETWSSWSVYMQGNAPQDSLSGSSHRLLYALMVIAATAVILVSLLGIATMTGVIPRADAEKVGNEAIRNEPRSVLGQQGDGAAAGKRPNPAPAINPKLTRSIVDCSKCVS